MTKKICIIEQKVSAGLNMFRNKCGFINMAVIWFSAVILLLFTMVHIVNYSVYSYKCMLIGRAIDYAVCAAVQEIDDDMSLQGISKGFDENTGEVKVSNIFFDYDRAEQAFYSIFTSNSGIKKNVVEKNITFVITCPIIDEIGKQCIKYAIKRADTVIEGVLFETGKIEDTINAQIMYGDVDKTRTIFVGGNPNTNEFSMKPYYMAIIKNFEITGVLFNRKVTYIGFKAGRVNRRGE